MLGTEYCHNLQLFKMFLQMKNVSINYVYTVASMLAQISYE